MFVKGISLKAQILNCLLVLELTFKLAADIATCTFDEGDAEHFEHIAFTIHIKGAFVGCTI